MSVTMLALTFLGPEATNQKPYTAEAVIKFFTELKNTEFKGRYYTAEALAYFTRAKTLGINLKALDIYPKDFKPKDIVVSGKNIALVAIQKQKPKGE